MSKFTTVLFDLDGTLIDTNHLIVTSFQYILRTELGLEVEAQEIYPYFGEPLVRTMARYDAARATELTNLYRDFNGKEHDRLIRQFPGVREGLVQLQAAGVNLGVVTSKFSDIARRGLQVCGLESFFPTLVGVDHTEKHKPDPEPVLKALEWMAVVPGPQVLMVGDSTFDVACGRNAGVQTAAVGWTVNRPALEAGGANYWVESPADLVNLILGEREAAD